MKTKYRLNLKTFLWGYVLFYSIYYSLYALTHGGLSVIVIPIIGVIAWRFIVNIKSCKTEEYVHKYKINFIYDKRTYFWKVIVIVWGIVTIRQILNPEIVSEIFVFILMIFVWRLLGNRNRCQRPEIQQTIQRKKFEKEKRIEQKKIAKRAKKANSIRCESYPSEHLSSSYSTDKSSVGKNVALAGAVVGYAGLRTIYSLTKPYMGGKKRRRRRRKRW